MRKKEEPLPLRRHSVPARRHRMVREQIPIPAVVKLAFFVGYFAYRVAMHNHAVTDRQMGDIKLHRDDSVGIPKKPLPFAHHLGGDRCILNPPLRALRKIMPGRSAGSCLRPFSSALPIVLGSIFGDSSLPLASAGTARPSRQISSTS